jgi:hypothetical protein
MIGRPQRALGTLVGAASSLAALALAAALLATASDWPISFTQFLAYTGAGALVLLSLVFAFWTYSCFSLRYALEADGLTIRWGRLKHFVSTDRIQEVLHGRGEHQPRVRGLSWWGYHVGRGNAHGLGQVLFFSTHRAPEELVYVRTAEATYGLSPQEPLRFIAEVKRLREAATAIQAEDQTGARPAVERGLPASHPLWTDRIGQGLMVAAVALNLAMWGYVFAVYPDLDNQITIEFPPIGDITTLHSRLDILKIPGTATAFLAVNLLAGLGFQWRERAAAHLLLSGTILLQVVFLIAAAVAVTNA